MRRRAQWWLPLLLLGPWVAACPSSPAPEPPSTWTASSAGGRLLGTLRPESGPPQIGRPQRWILQLTTSGGEPVYPARIGVNGGMPAHGHGLPTAPQVTEHLGDGRYRIEGLQFNMAGAWVLLFTVETPTARDRLQLELDLRW